MKWISDQEAIDIGRVFFSTKIKPFVYRHRLKFTIAICILLIYLSSFGELIQFPFTAGVWGNASDFLTLLITFFTAYYVLITFRQEQDIRRIEQQNFRLQFLPKIKITYSGNEILFKVEDNAIKKYHFYSPNNGYFTLLDDWMLHGHRHMDLGVGHSHPIHTRINNPKLGTIETLMFIFLDTQNNLYQQYTYIATSTHEVKIQTPKFIANLKSDSEFQTAVHKIIAGSRG